LALGECGLETDTRKVKFGDGATAWTGLSYGVASPDILGITATKATPVDADQFAITDSESGGILKRLSWANIKAALLLAFDLVYMKLTGLDGVMVTKKTGTRRVYVASADTDTARGLALEAAMNAAIAGDTIDLTPGNYLVSKAYNGTTVGGFPTRFAILDKMTINFNGARLYITSTPVAHNALVVGTYYTIGAAGGTAAWTSVGAANNNGGTTFQATGTAVSSGTGSVIPTPCAMFCNAYVSGVMGGSDWSLLGPGVIEGSAATSTGTGYTNEIGINMAAGRRWRIENLTVIKHQGTNVQFNNADFTNDATGYSTGWKSSTGHVSHCNFDMGNIGMGNYAGNEYITFTDCTFNKNITPCDIYAGNTKFIGCEASANTTNGIRIRRVALANDQHGCWIGGHITHNAGFAVQLEAGATDSLGNVTNTGFIFSGVTFGADSTATNKIQSLGGGLNLNSCYLQSPIFASGTPTGLNFIQNCFIAGTPGAADDLTSISDLSAAERLKWVFDGNNTLVGGWSQNDDRIYSFADNTAALAGGLTAGRKYRNSTTNAVSVVV
jgi:hypothetical protein